MASNAFKVKQKESRLYRVTLMLSIDSSESDRTNIQDSLEKMIIKNSGSVQKVEKCNMMGIAYPIKKQYKAYYFITWAYSLSHMVHECKNEFKYNNFVLRCFIDAVDTVQEEDSGVYIKSNEDK